MKRAFLLVLAACGSSPPPVVVSSGGITATITRGLPAAQVTVRVY